MVFTDRLPQLSHLGILANHATYPADVPQLVRLATDIGYGPGLINFLKLFSPQTRFDNPTEFIVECEELELLLEEERQSPKEQPRNPLE